MPCYFDGFGVLGDVFAGIILYSLVDIGIWKFMLMEVIVYLAGCRLFPVRRLRDVEGLLMVAAVCRVCYCM